MRKTTTGFLLLTMLSTYAPPAHSDRFPYNGLGFVSVVLDVDELGQIVFENGESIRPWGILPERIALRDLILGKELVCHSPSNVSVARIDSSVSHCDFFPNREINYWIGSPAQLLLQSGDAIEICAESRNKFGTCGG